MKKNIQTDYEINFIELLQIIWQGKWKMVVVVVIFVLSTFIYQANQIKNFTAITTIVPVSTFDISKYSLLNSKTANIFAGKNTMLWSFNLVEPDLQLAQGKDNRITKLDGITRLKLLNLYIDVLNDKKLFQDAIRKFNLLDSSQYSNELDYNVAVANMASKIKIFKPIVKKKKRL